MKKDNPKIEVHCVEGRCTTIRQPTFFTNDVHVPDDPSRVPRISPFLAWKVLDEFGETSKVSLPDRVERFLKAIDAYVAVEANIKVEGKTENQVREYLKTIKDNSVALELAPNFMSIFRLYVPVREHSVSLPIEMYWGAAFEVVQISIPLPGIANTLMHAEYAIKTFYKSPVLATTIQKYSALVSNISSIAQRLHEGVYCFRVVQDPRSKEWRYEDAVADSAILLAVIVDATGAILRMIVETIRSLRDKDVYGDKDENGDGHENGDEDENVDEDENDDDIMSPARQISRHGKDACELFRNARDQLIKEADGRDKNGNIGPVVTTEAVTIALLESLASGVLHNGTLDIILLYEECLEYLV